MILLASFFDWKTQTQIGSAIRSTLYSWEVTRGGTESEVGLPGNLFSVHSCPSLLPCCLCREFTARLNDCLAETLQCSSFLLCLFGKPECLQKFLPFFKAPLVVSCCLGDFLGSSGQLHENEKMFFNLP